MESASTRKVAFITGIAGQDGSYLAELLLAKSYEVHGLVRRNTSEEGSNFLNITKIQDQLTIHYGDVVDMNCLIDILKKCQPTEIYNLAAQSHVTLSFTIPEYTFQVNQGGCLNLLQAIVHCGLTSNTRLYQASTSELFGGDADHPLNETSSFNPQSPYAISKLAAYWLVNQYREAYGLFAVNGLAFNHESPRRSRRFVTKRIACGVAEYMINKRPMMLANVGSCRDWGHARDYVYGMWLMLQQDTPQDLVLATGSSYSVRDFLVAAFKHVEIDLLWSGDDENLTALDPRDSFVILRLDQKLRRPTEVRRLLGDSSKAKRILGWEAKTNFEADGQLKELVAEMVDGELQRVESLRAAIPSEH